MTLIFEKSTTSNTASIGLIERASLIARMIGDNRQSEKYRPVSFDSVEACLAGITSENIDLIILDLSAPGGEGMAMLKSITSVKNAPPVIVTTEAGSVRMAVEAMRQGAVDFLIKPFDRARLVEAMNIALNRHVEQSLPALLAGNESQNLFDRAGHNIARAHIPDSPARRPGFIGTSAPMQRAYDQIEHAAASKATVFITGESGTGKEVCAETIHRLSPRADKPFIPINCAAIPRDLMESELFGHVKGAFTGAIADREGAASLANGGTLFLDEIAEMNPDMQTKLLRFLQDFSFSRVGGSRLEKTDVRVICATNRAPLDEIAAGRFREDLYYRLHVLPIHMPPLRLRGEDVIDLAQTFLQRYAKEEGKHFTGFTPGAETLIRRYNWPGNIRQLQNILRQIVVMHDDLQVTHEMLPPELHQDQAERHFSVVRPDHAGHDHNQPRLRTLEEIEREAIEAAINVFAGNIPRAAAALGVSPSTLYRKKAAWDQSTHQNKSHH